MSPSIVNEAANRLNLSLKTVRLVIKRSQLPRVRPVGRAVRVPEEAVDAILSQRSQPPKPIGLAGGAS